MYSMDTRRRSAAHLDVVYFRPTICLAKLRDELPERHIRRELLAWQHEVREWAEAALS